MAVLILIQNWTNSLLGSKLLPQTALVLWGEKKQYLYMNSAHPFSQRKSFIHLWCWPKYNFITYTHCFEFYFFFRMGFQKHRNDTHVWMPLRVYAVPNSTKKSNGHFLGNWAASPNPPYWSQTLCNIMAAYPDSSCIPSWSPHVLHSLPNINFVEQFSICQGETGQERKGGGGYCSRLPALLPSQKSMSATHLLSHHLPVLSA